MGDNADDLIAGMTCSKQDVVDQRQLIQDDLMRILGKECPYCKGLPNEVLDAVQQAIEDRMQILENKFDECPKCGYAGLGRNIDLQGRVLCPKCNFRFHRCGD